MVKVLLSIIISIVLLWGLGTWASNHFSFKYEYNVKEMEKVDDTITKMRSDNSFTLQQVTVEIPSDAAVYMFDAKETEVGMSLNGYYRVFQRPNKCDFPDDCICYCNKYIELDSKSTGGGGVVNFACESDEETCISYKGVNFTAKEPPEFFDMEFSSILDPHFKGGFLILPLLEENGIDFYYRNRLTFDRIGTGTDNFYVCIRNDGGHC